MLPFEWRETIFSCIWFVLFSNILQPLAFYELPHKSHIFVRCRLMIDQQCKNYFWDRSLVVNKCQACQRICLFFMHRLQRISRTAGRKAIGTVSSGWQCSSDKPLQITCLHLQLQWLARQAIWFLFWNRLPAISESKQWIRAGARAQTFTSSTPERLGSKRHAAEVAGWDVFTLHGNVIWVQLWVQIYEFVVEHGPKRMLFAAGHCQTWSVLVAVEFEEPPILMQLWTSDRTAYHLRSTAERYLIKVAKIQNMTQRQWTASNAMQRLWVINRFTWIYHSHNFNLPPHFFLVKSSSC